MDTKLQIARAQLGTALSLFLKDRDPISVHALACGGCEIMEGIAMAAGIPTLSAHVIAMAPEIDLAAIKSLRNKYWNAIKHFQARSAKVPRDDDALMLNFSDAMNDAPLFMGWLDYLLFMKRQPLEAQVFMTWWYATNEDKLSPNANLAEIRKMFPGINDCDRAEQKRRMRRLVEKSRKEIYILAHPRTEARRL